MDSMKNSSVGSLISYVRMQSMMQSTSRFFYPLNHLIIQLLNTSHSEIITVFILTFMYICRPTLIQKSIHSDTFNYH